MVWSCYVYIHTCGHLTKTPFVLTDTTNPAIGHFFLDHVMFNQDGILARTDHMARAKERWGMAVQGCLRADLIDLLAKPLLVDGVLRYSTTVTGVEQARPDKWV